jgi:hypothetical protein
MVPSLFPDFSAPAGVIEASCAIVKLEIAIKDAITALRFMFISLSY